MQLIKKYTAIQITSKKVNNDVIVELEYGRIMTATEPITEFETEEEATEWAFKENKYGNWLILPIVSFKRNL